MDFGIRERKAAVRREVSQRVAAMSAEIRQERSRQACQLLNRQKAWQQAGSILLFAPTSREVDIWPLLASALASGKLVALPRFDPGTNQYEACRVTDSHQQVRTGRYGIREPGPACAVVALNRLDFVLAPGVAFDLHGRRLGRGKGYYDRLLTAVGGTTCGVAFDEQMVNEIPVEPHDSDVNCILTPTRWIEL